MPGSARRQAQSVISLQYPLPTLACFKHHGAALCAASARNMSSIVLEALSRQFGTARPAVDNVNLTIQAGSFTVLLGPSGCGKSTTLRMIAGLEMPTAGRILMNGRDVTALSPRERHIAMVFQSYALFPHLSVRENILFGLKVRKEPREHYAERLARTARVLGLEDLLDRKPSQLSGGQQQRVALGRAVISEASVCLMDEPLSNLDAQLRQEMRREIRALQQSLGITMVYVTHDQTEAMSMADRVVIMNGGRIEQHDSPDALYASPATEFAARFIGTPAMNLIKLEPGHRRIAGCNSAPLGPTPEGASRLGIRPEHIELKKGDNSLGALVESIEYFGADSIVVCRLGSNSGVAVRTKGHFQALPGSAVQLSWRAEHERFFDAKGAALSAPRTSLLSGRARPCDPQQNTPLVLH